MTRIKVEPNNIQVGTSDLQNAENVRSNPVPGKGSENSNVAIPREALASKLSEVDLQAKARATELNSLLNSKATDQPKPPGGDAFYDLMVSGFKDSNPKTESQADAERLRPEVKSIEIEDLLISNLVDPKKSETGN